MSYSVHLFTRATEARHKAAARPDFFEDEKNLAPFSAEDAEHLSDALELRGYEEKKPSSRGRLFANADLGVQALLTARGLYFMGASGEDAIFEISMTASELADERFAKYDPQVSAWE